MNSKGGKYKAPLLLQEGSISPVKQNVPLVPCCSICALMLSVPKIGTLGTHGNLQLP